MYLPPSASSDPEASEPTASRSDPSAGLPKLWESSSIRLFKAGQHVFRAGDVQPDLYKVASGVIRIYRNMKDGRRQVIAFLFPGDLIGLELQPQYLYNAQAIDSASLDRVSVEAVRALALEDSGVLFDLYARLANEIVAAQDLVLTLGRANPEERLAYFLFVLFRRNRQHGRDPFAIDLSMPRADIADHLGLTIETVSRTLTKLGNRGLIKLAGRRSIRILDLDAVEGLAQGLRRVPRRRRKRR